MKYYLIIYLGIRTRDYKGWDSYIFLGKRYIVYKPYKLVVPIRLI